MLAQAEHDADASAVLLTTSKRLAAAVAREVDRQLAVLPTAPVAAKAIARNSAVVLVGSLDEAMEIANRFAPEHLSIPDAGRLAKVRHAGGVFVGAYSPEAAGDYASGPNHVLPTGGAARQRGGLAVTDYVKVISVQELSQAALRRLGAGHHHAGARRGPGSARALGGSAGGRRCRAARSRSRSRTEPRP